MDSLELRQNMVERQLAHRGIVDQRVLEAFRAIPREAFLPAGLEEFAYRDAPLPIGEGQTISQPYIVALTLQALELAPDDRALEIGTGSGYAAALMSRLTEEVVTVERHASLARAAQARFERLGLTNIHVRVGDGTLGWPDQAPYQAIAVAAGGPSVPKALLAQLAPGGRLVIPVGSEEETQTLTRVRRAGRDEFHREALASVRFVPLVGEQGWPEPAGSALPARPRSRPETVAALVREAAEPLADPDEAPLDALLDRIGGGRLVLLGEASHGTREFYRLRARITRELLERRGFDFVAVEADWPDAARIDAFVFGDTPRTKVSFTPFARFPTWMWRNREVHDFVEWLRARNLERSDRQDRSGFHGLDLYSLFTSIAVVLGYLDEVDRDAARVARVRYGTLTPWQKDPAAYGEAVLAGRYASSENAVVGMLRDLLHRRLDYAERDGERFFDAAQNAHVVADAEAYYRAMYYGSAASWNLRDAHMFQTLVALLGFYGEGSRAVVWAHNSHLGDAAATEMSARGELNLGQLCRHRFGEEVYAVGFGTDHGTVCAASNWGEEMQRMRVRPAHPLSYEKLCHDAGTRAFLLPLREPRRPALRDELTPSRLERAIGVIYRPDTELQSHYFQACLPRQFDEWIWLDETHALEPLPPPGRPAADLPETYPFGL